MKALWFSLTLILIITLFVMTWDMSNYRLDKRISKLEQLCFDMGDRHEI